LRWFALLFFVEFLFQPFRITGRCLTFFPICRCSSAKTISGVRSKNPMPFFPAHPAAAVLQTDELLFHLPPTVWTDFVACTHASSCTSVKRINDKLEVVTLSVDSPRPKYRADPAQLSAISLAPKAHIPPSAGSADTRCGRSVCLLPSP